MLNIEEAITILRENITSIHTVTGWSRALGYPDRKRFFRAFRKEFGLQPKEALQEIRIEQILENIEKYPADKNFCVAIEFGFTDDQGLNKFLKRHTGLTPTEWRKRLVKKAS